MTQRRIPLPLLTVSLLAVLVPGLVQAATPGATPAATLLLPYFEVDLREGFDRQTTLFSVNNAAPDPLIAHVVLWTDWGIPTYSFDLVLAGDDVLTVNLRDLFWFGDVPATDGSAVSGCGDPVVVPPLDADALAALRARHTGRPDPEDGDCYGSGRQGEEVAVGYVTVDVATRCVGGSTYFPGDDGYFSPAGNFLLPRFVGDQNALWGDVFYVAAGDDSAQGTELVHVPFDPEAGEGETFYRLWAPDGEDGRALLGSLYRGRFLEGGPFDAGADLLVWVESGQKAEPGSCESRNLDQCQGIRFRLFDEDGEEVATSHREASHLAFRLPVGGAELPTPVQFGFFELHNSRVEACELPNVFDIRQLQAWVTTVMKAQGRFSLGVAATRIPVPGEP